MLDSFIQPFGEFSVSLLEISANFITAMSIWLAARNNFHTWWVGIVGCVLFGFLFFLSQLYADLTLQIFFIATSCLGWLQWVQKSDGLSLTVQRSNFAFILTRVLFAVVVAIAYGSILYKFTDAFAPYIDSLVLTFSVLAQLLMMQRRIESWPVWLVVNTISVPLYLSRGLNVTAFFYAVYWVNVLYGFSHWRKELAKA